MTSHTVHSFFPLPKMETFMLQLHYTQMERHYSFGGKLAPKIYGCMIHGLQVVKRNCTPAPEHTQILLQG